MNSLNLPNKSLQAIVLLVAISASSANVVHAEEVVPAKAQSDAQISVWVNDAPLSLFVSQLALITGRQAEVQTDLEGQVSGRFSGSMADTLESLGDQFPVLFDLDENTLAMVASTEKSSATLALGESVVGEQTKLELQTGLIQGNEVDVREREIIVSGHPDFVKRTARKVASLISDQNKQVLGKPAIENLQVDQAGTKVDGTSSDVVQLQEQPVVDVAAKVMVSDDEEAAPAASAASSSVSAVNAQTDIARPVRRIRSVTDIPGFNTF